ncbi:phage integrase [Gynuella sunshinyii]|uniref:Site-specific recombinase XerD n=1 Tax=Gynuella sunshinyii YC6258 TaxID=1445510 RepID=A0A0C5VDD8_9GAMM|nr:tyrosine-type recombinase/integrase [Gynuella sunshinyii]AJQ92231.1 site-specific recombinase XerD [Gynuella sunshinyii YC6258]
MAIYKTSTGWQVRFAFDGKQYKKNLKSRREALSWESQTRLKLEKGETLVPKYDKRRLSDLVTEWYNFHGHSLKTGSTRQKELVRIIEEIGNPVAAKFKASDFAEYRVKKLAEGTSENTLNHYHIYLSAVFSELIRAGEWTLDNPLKRIKKMKTSESDMAYLSTSEICRLLASCEISDNPQLIAPVKLCLATGARWGEATSLQWPQLKPDRVTFTDTKNGKNRTVPISLELYQELKSRGRSYGTMFPGDFKRSFNTALKRAEISLPSGQKTHVLRHTFASHFIMNGGDLLTLQKVLGHGSLDMVLKYAHLAPEHLEQALQFNPLKTISP